MPTIPSYDDLGARTSDLGTFYDWPTGGTTPTGTFTAVTKSERGGMPVSIGHRRSPDGSYRSGGPWVQYKQTLLRTDNGSYTTFRPHWGVAYDGSYICSDGSDNSNVHGLLGHDFDNQSLQDDAFGFGAQAMGALSPDKPDFTALAALYELRDPLHEIKAGLQSLRKRVRDEQRRLRKRGHKSVSSNAAEFYLAEQFGWLPFFSDIKNFFDAFEKKDKHAQQIIRDARRPIKRSRILQASTTKNDSWDSEIYPVSLGSYQANPIMFPSHVSQCYPRYLQCAIKTRTYYETRTWTEGKSSYFLPKMPPELLAVEVSQRLLGFNLTPTQVYSVIPWSWLVDYFTGLGDFMRAVSPGVADLVVFEYAYVMRETLAVRETEASQYTYSNVSGDQAQQHIAVRKQVSSTKTRANASVLGFGFKDASLTARQTAILGALGLSRLS